jgi:WD40 repeat protein
MYLRFIFLPCLLCLVLGALQATCGEPLTGKNKGARGGNMPKRTDHYGDPLPTGTVFRIGTTHLRHYSRVIRPFVDVRFNWNGKFVYSSAHEEHEVRMWETATGREVRHFPAWNSDPTFSLSADGSLLAVGDFAEIHLYDTATGKKGRTINLRPLKSFYVSHLTFSPDGKILTAHHSGMQAGTNSIGRWDTATGKMIANYEIPSSDWLRDLSADARLMATIAHQDRAIRLWKTAAVAKVREWKAEGEDPMGFRSLRFSPDGCQVVTAGEDAMIRVYETATGKEVRNWPVPLRETDSSESTRETLRISWRLGNPRTRAAVGELTFAPDGQTLASVDCLDVLRLWDWKTGRELRHFKDVSGPVSFSPDSKSLAAGGVDSRLHLWSTTTGRDLCPFVDPGKIINVAFSPDGRVLAAGLERGESRLFDAETSRELRHVPGYRFVAFSPRGGRLLVRSQEGERFGPWCLLDAATGRELTRFRGTEENIYSYFGGWDAENKLLLTGNSPSVRVWDTTTGKIRHEMRDKEEEKYERYCSRDGRFVAVTNRQDPIIRLVAPDTGRELRQLTGYSWAVGSEARRGKASQTGGGACFPLFSPNGKMLLAGCASDSLGLWDVNTGKQLHRLSCRQLLPHNPIFSAEGDRLVLLDTQGDPCVVDTATGRVCQRLTRQGGDLSWILDSVRALSADGRLLAAAYDPQTLVLWEIATGRPVRTWPGHGRGQLWQMVFSSDSRRLATVSTDGTALVWDVTGVSPNGQFPARRLTPAETEQAWRDLADADAAKAHRALWLLVADPPQALPLLRQRLHAMPGIGPRRLARLIANLDSDDFTVREKATRQLRKLGESARPVLRAAGTNQFSLEVRRRVRALLDELDGGAIPVECVRDLRAVAVLEHIGSAEARQWLDHLAGGLPEARLTREAKVSLARLRSGRAQP